MRTAWLIAGALVTVLTLVVTTVGLSRGIAMAQAPSEHTARTIPLPGNAQLRIEANGGHIRLAVHAGEAGVIVVDRQLEWTRDKPSVSEDWNGRTLRLGLLLRTGMAAGRDLRGRLSAVRASGDRHRGHQLHRPGRRRRRVRRRARHLGLR